MPHVRVDLYVDEPSYRFTQGFMFGGKKHWRAPDLFDFKDVSESRIIVVTGEPHKSAMAVFVWRMRHDPNCGAHVLALAAISGARSVRDRFTGYAEPFRIEDLVSTPSRGPKDTSPIWKPLNPRQSKVLALSCCRSANRLVRDGHLPLRPRCHG